jgi:hypothetical protein
VFGPIGELALIVVLVVFMLLERMRLRVRFLRLIGHSRLATTTLAIDEAGSRLSGFLFGQLLVNTGYAVVLRIGLFLIGIPNALLWAVLTVNRKNRALIFVPASTKRDRLVVNARTNSRKTEDKILLSQSAVESLCLFLADRYTTSFLWLSRGFKATSRLANPNSGRRDRLWFL